VAKGGRERIAAEKRLRCDVYVYMEGLGSIASLRRCTRWVTDLNDVCSDETTRRGAWGTQRPHVGYLLWFAFGMAKAEEGHALCPDRDVERGTDAGSGRERQVI
jgi:hypothetical protein